MVQTFSSDRADHSLNVCPLPWRPRRAEHFLDVHDGDLLAKCIAVNPVLVTQQIFWCSLKRKSFHDLPCRPFGGRMLGHIEMHQSATIMLDHDEDKQHLKSAVGTVKKST